ncbi:MAG: polysaccharide lyase 8 family protein [Spirochaetales bacterium]|nr:polysaccharide lyase 8 family protein [Spirochaetales bacterium]
MKKIIFIFNFSLLFAGCTTYTLESSLLYSQELSTTKILSDLSGEKNFEKLRALWRAQIVVDDYSYLTDGQIRIFDKKINELDEAVEQIIEGQIDFEADSVFVGLCLGSSSRDLSKAFSKVRQLSVVYSTKGSKFYKDSELLCLIKKSLGWLNLNYYSERVFFIYDNWWDFNIQIPQQLCDILILLYSDLDEDFINKFLAVLDHFNADPFNSVTVGNSHYRMQAANLLDRLIVKALTGIIANSSSHMEIARDGFSDLLPYVRSGNGFYEDGSYIDHFGVPYAGNYGIVVLNKAAEILLLTQNSNWPVTDEKLNNVFAWIIDSYMPLYFSGGIMDAVSGRMIWAKSSSMYSRGIRGLVGITKLASFAPESLEGRILAFAKSQFQQLPDFERFIYSFDLGEILLVENLLNDSSVPIRGFKKSHRTYNSMDRVVHHRQEWSACLSMFSSRISAFATGNNENLTGWNMGSGALYLYNADLSHYADEYWLSVDPMRLAGITSDFTEREIVPWRIYRSANDWAGGVSLRSGYGSAGMDFSNADAKNSNLSGKKSWFFFDDEIVALGSNIKKTKNSHRVVTVAENRKIVSLADSVIYVDGQKFENGYHRRSFEAKSVFFGGNRADGSDSIGYFFPEKEGITVSLEQRINDIQLLSPKNPAEDSIRDYFGIDIEHGKFLEGESYYYIIVPGMDREQVQPYLGSLPVEVLSQDNIAHGVTHHGLGITAVNFWQDGRVGRISSYSSVAFIMNEVADGISIAVSDPTQQLDSIRIEVEMDGLREVKSASPGVDAFFSGKKLIIEIDCRESGGRVYYLDL